MDAAEAYLPFIVLIDLILEEVYPSFCRLELGGLFCNEAEIGKLAGAVYRPVASIVPSVAFPPATPFTPHVTAVLVVFVTITVNCCVAPTRTGTFPPGDTLTIIRAPGGAGDGAVEDDEDVDPDCAQPPKDS